MTVPRTAVNSRGCCCYVVGDGTGRRSYSALWSAREIVGHDWQVHLWTPIWYIEQLRFRPLGITQIDIEDF